MLPMMRVELSLVFEKPVVPDFPEALIRGGLGFTIRELVCLMPRGCECRLCPMASRCLFALMFDEKAKTHEAHQISAYNLFCRIDHKNPRVILLQLSLFKPLFEFLTHLVVIFGRAGEKGIGRERLTFRVAEVRDCANNAVLFDGNGIFDGGAMTESWSIPECFAVSDDCRLDLDFVSTTRMLRQGKLVSDPDFVDIAKACLSRFRILEAAFGEGDSLSNPVDWFDLAKQVSLHARNIQWVQKERFSSQRKISVSAGGFTGCLSFDGPLDSFVPLLEFGSIAGIGKNTTFGCGRFVIRY